MSFIGSIPLGAINLTSLQIYLHRDLKSVVYFSFAASAIEFVYSFFAIKGESLITSNSSLDLFFKYITVIVLFILGIVSVFSKNKTFSKTTIKHASNNNYPHYNFIAFRKGLTLGILNPLAIPFWIVMINVLEKQNLVHSVEPMEIFSIMLGVGLGGWLCIICFTYIVGRIIEKRELELTLVNKIIGFLFIGLGTFQLLKNLQIIN